ncbi:MAG: SH3 domain-containing protein [Deltaproteobacteria bacterium]|nr:SH3 domain-containing protein [Candidatus Zymogenaceae bacterium]
MNSKNRYPFILIFSVLVATAAFSTLPVWGQNEYGKPITNCNCNAYVVDTDPAGTNVRTGPGTDYTVIGTLPTGRPVRVHIAGSVGEWMRISSYTVFDEAAKGSSTDIDGWVSGKLLAVTTRVSTYAADDSRGFVTIYESNSYKSHDDVLAEIGRIPVNSAITLADAHGNWVKVNYKGVEGWLDPVSFCGDPFNECH